MVGDLGEGKTSDVRDFLPGRLPAPGYPPAYVINIPGIGMPNRVM